MSNQKNNAVQKAAAVSYNAKEPAPRVVASAEGTSANHIINVAKKAGVAIIKDTVLAEILSQYPAGSFIPERTYAAVAAVLVFADKLGSEQV